MSDTPRLDNLMRISSENPFSDAVCLIEELEHELAAKTAEVQRLRALATCGCGDMFTAHDPGTCGACCASLQPVIYGGAT